MSDWNKFGNEPLEGVFWVCGYYPEVDVDVDDYGMGHNWYTGEECQFVALAYLNFHPEEDDMIYEYAEPINEHELGYIGDDYTITHYKPLYIPNHADNEGT